MEKQIAQALPVAMNIAKAFCRTDYEELYSHLLEKLALLANRYDESKGTTFVQYASDSLRGYAKNFLRDTIKHIRYARGVYNILVAYEKHVAENPLLLEASIEQRAKHIGTTKQMLEHALMQKAANNVLHLDALLVEQPEAMSTSPTSSNYAHSAIRALPPDKLELLERYVSERQALTKEELATCNKIKEELRLLR